jgi:citryl-CoA lyase
MSQDLRFTTNISGQTQEGLELRGHQLTELIAEADFIATFFLSLTGRKPLPAERKILNAILVASLDHGLSPASGFVPRVVASSGTEMLACMATSLLALGPYHGGAITGAMEVFQLVDGYSEDKEAAAEWLVTSYLKQKKRIPGFGHPVYKKADPRAAQLFAVARNENIDIHYLNIARQIEHTLEDKTLKPLILNIDGAIAALLLALKIEPLAGNAIFGLARVAGSVAHILEEQQSGKWVRRIDPEDITYRP